MLVEAEAVHGPVTGVWGPKVAPETLIVDHGKIYVSAHLTSVCRRMGISVQPARLRTGRDKGPVERFFRTLREDLLQRLPGYKGPDIHSRGLNPEKDAFFFHHELRERWEAIAPELAGHVVAVGYEPDSGRLTVRPESSARATMARLEQTRIIAAANKSAGWTVVRALRQKPPSVPGFIGRTRKVGPAWAGSQQIVASLFAHPPQC
ncbi:DciA family protein [Streptomyces sp. NPDC059378]|uniref:DUF721 domain-containing protein n=1 Tax=Streptomyces sp. NPDC059378 TaxID=3346815 RepID=UPI0036B03CED